MKYRNAKVVFPDALVKELQNYVQGEYIYIPVDSKNQKRWGEVSGYRRELKLRNENIKKEYKNGNSIEFLSEKYNLSISAIRKIIYQK